VTSDLCRPVWVVPTSEDQYSRLMAGQSNAAGMSSKGTSGATRTTHLIEPSPLDGVPGGSDSRKPLVQELQRCRTVGAGRVVGNTLATPLLSLQGSLATFSQLFVGLPSSAGRKTAAGARPDSSRGWLLSSMAGPDSITRVTPEPSPPASRLRTSGLQNTFMLHSTASHVFLQDPEQEGPGGSGQQASPPEDPSGLSMESSITDLLGPWGPPSPDRPSGAGRSSAQSRHAHLANSKHLNEARTPSGHGAVPLRRHGTRSLSGAAG
jgi:hypothetical protein